MKNEADYKERKTNRKEYLPVPGKIPSYLLKSKTNLKKNGLVRFQVGLILSMTMAYIAPGMGLPPAARSSPTSGGNHRRTGVLSSRTTGGNPLKLLPRLRRSLFASRCKGL